MSDETKPQTTAGTCPSEHGGKREDCAAWPACACDNPPLIHVTTHASEQDRKERRVHYSVSIFRGIKGNG